MRLDLMELPRHLPDAALLTPAEMAAVDEAAGDCGLMERAGRAVARAAARFGPCRTLVLCGPGNNGGDGYVAARLLAQSGWPVRVAALAPPRPASEAAVAAGRWRGPMVAFSAVEAGRAELVIDAVFGAGIDRPVAAAVSGVLAAAGRVVAVDVPSGLDGANGQALGVVRAAALTVSFVAAKPGHLLLPGRDLCGELVIADIGMPAAALAVVQPLQYLNRPGLWSLPVLNSGSHKYTRGHVTVLGGAQMTGAARLAAAAGRHGGAGLVTIAAESGADLYRAGAAGVIVSDAGIASLLADERRMVWVCGPGLGQLQAAAALARLIAAGRTIVADADALGACAGAPERLRGVSVITPHAGEFAKLFGDAGGERVAAARAAAALIGAVVLLKGADTIVAAPDGRVAINASAPPWLATAGAGDVLAGLIAALLAQGMAAWEAACAGAWLHGRAAARLGAGLLAEDLPGALPGAIAEAAGWT